MVTEARARRDGREGGVSAAVGGDKDSWRADLPPRAAVRARTILALEHQRDLLRARLAEVRFFLVSFPLALRPPPAPPPKKKPNLIR